MKAQELLDLIDEHNRRAGNLTAGLTADGDDELVLEDDDQDDDDEQ